MRESNIPHSGKHVKTLTKTIFINNKQKLSGFYSGNTHKALLKHYWTLLSSMAARSLCSGHVHQESVTGTKKQACKQTNQKVCRPPSF